SLYFVRFIKFGCLTFSVFLQTRVFRIYRETLSRFSCAASTPASMSNVLDWKMLVGANGTSQGGDRTHHGRTVRGLRFAA
ncbi:hypothetical protein ABLO03_01130, partial [Mycobacterium tuberculosis]